MTPPLLIAQLTPFSAEGHGEYRVHGPGRRLARVPGVTVVDCDPDHRWAPWLAEHADVLVLHTIAPDGPPLAARRRGMGRATLLEAADHYLDPQPWSEYSLGWLDRSRQDLFWALVAAVDAVQTSTPTLAGVWAPVARRVLVLPNRLPAVPPLAPRPDRPLTVGWAGTATHLPDWYAVAPAVDRWVRDHPPARLAVMTDELARPFVRLPADRYAFRPPGNLGEYVRFVRELDVAVVPLLPAPFNLGRTDLKFLELAALGVIGVFAAEGPYPAAVVHGRTGFLYRTAAELTAVLDRLAADAGLRERVRRAAHAVAVAREKEDTTADRLAAYRELVPVPRNPPLPDGLLAEAVAEERCVALPPGEPERVIAGGDPVAVADVIGRYPGFVAARRAAARAVLRAGRAADAVAALEPLLGGPAETPEVLIEAAAGYAAGGDAPTARALAERAVGLSPAFAGGWAVLTRLAGDDGGPVAKRAARNQPRSYLAGLATLKFLSGEDRRRRADELIERFAADAHPEERPYLAAAFGRAFAELLGADPEAAGVLGRACRAFPESARLADAHAAVLYAAGRVAEAAGEHTRAAGLERIHRAFALEYPDPAAARRLWAVGEYARTYAPEEPSGA